MSELDELRARVDRIEAELAAVRAKAESAETLARFTDRDTSDIKASHAAIIQSLNALRETQVEQGQTLADHGRLLNDHGRILNDHGRILNEHSRILNEHSRILNEHSRAHEVTHAGIRQIIDMLTRLGEQPG